METFNCGICFERYDEDEKRVPRTLAACGHTICEICALKIMKNAKVVCPFDRIESDVPDGNIKNLEKNFAILEAIQEQQYKQTSVETEDDAEYEAEKALGIPCDEDRTHISVFYCTICKVHLYSRCSILSHSSKMLSSHKMVKVTEKPEPLLMCPRHTYNVAELYCQEKGCKSENEIMCTNCHLYGVHKGHEYKTIDEIFETKKIETLDLLNKTNVKKGDVKSHIATIGKIPDDVENDEEYVDVKNHIVESCNKFFAVINNWKQENLDMLMERVKEKIENQRKEKEDYDSQLGELEILAKKCLNMTKQGKAEYFEKSADFLTAVKKLESIEVSEPSKLIELKPLVPSLDSHLSSFCETSTSTAKQLELKPLIQPPTLCESLFCDTNKSIRKIVYFSTTNSLQKHRSHLKKLAGFQEDKSDVFRMQDQLGNPYYVYFWHYEVFKTSSINKCTPNTTFYLNIWTNESFIEKFKTLPKDATIIIPDYIREDLMNDWNEEYRNMMRHISAPIFSCNDCRKIFMEVAKGNYENNPFFKRWMNEEEQNSIGGQMKRVNK